MKRQHKGKLRLLLTFMLVALLSIFVAPPVSAADPTTINYGDYLLDEPLESTHWSDIWDLTQCDLTLSYTIDMSGITQPHGLPGDPTEWEAYIGPTAKDPSNYPNSYTPWVEVGLRGEGAADFNPGPFGVYQGKCGGWMVSESDDWVGFWDGGVFYGDGTETQDLDDKHSLQASGGRSELDYDVLCEDPETVVSVPSPYSWYPSPKGAYGSWDNFGLWFDRDGVDQWQATSWGNLGPGGVGSGDGLRYNTGGIYDIVITYHAIDEGLGVMCATVNGYPQGFYTSWVNGPPQDYPAGLSFKGNMAQMQVFAGWLAYDPAGWDYGSVQLSNIEVTGCLGVSDPLVADFSYIPSYPNPDGSVDVDFTDATHGGMMPYEYAWDFENDSTVDSTEQNPTHTYPTAGDYTVKLTVTPFRCEPESVTKTIHLRMDYGDAPAPYPEDVYHEVVEGIYLGSYIDSEPKATPDPNASGDDYDNSPDDEDGISFNTSLVPCQQANITVIASVDGYLSGWIDFNADGDWDDPGEMIFDNYPLTTGENQLSFTVPCGAVIGNTYARFRFSTDDTIESYQGFAPNGEIEDYMVEILPPPPPVGSEAYPINKIGLIAPWVALAVVIAAGGFYLVRRRVHNLK